MGILRDEQRAGRDLLAPVLADGLRDSDDVCLIEGSAERGATMAGRAEAYPLRANVGMRPVRVVERDEPRDVG